MLNRNHPVDEGVLDDRSSSSTAYSNTIWASVPSSTEVSPSNAYSATDTISSAAEHLPSHPLTSSLTLSLEPTMIDSAVFSNFNEVASRANTNTEESEETELDALSFYSSISNSSISSCSVASVPDHSPYLFTNIGRALLQLSANENESINGVSTDDVSTYFQGRNFTTGRNNGKEWWSRFRTEEDWEAFAEMAAQYLSTLVSAELMEMDENIKRDRDPWIMKEASNSAVVYGCQRDSSFSMAKIWFHRIYNAITSVLGANSGGLYINKETQVRMNYISYLVKELAIVQQRLNTLPPIPPTLPPISALEELPEDTRMLLTQQCSAWRAETIKERELLELKESTYREEILSAIIETEEELFWSKDSPKLGSYTDDGYFQVTERNSPYWDEIDEHVYISSRRKCQMSFRYLIALTAGAAGVASLLLQSKKR